MEKTPDKQLRKTLDNLRITGLALIFLGFWDILKFILYVTTGFGNTPDSSADSALSTGEWLIDLMIFFFMIVDIIFRLFIGLRAIREEKAKRHGKLHLVLAGGMFIFLCISMVYSFIFSTDSQYLDTYLASFLMDITTLWTLFELVHLTLRARKLQRQLSPGASPSL